MSLQLDAISEQFYEASTNNNAFNDSHSSLKQECRRKDRSISRVILKLRELAAYMDDLDSTYERRAAELNADKIDHDARIKAQIK
jgi:hypothetical protein